MQWITIALIVVGFVIAFTQLIMYDVAITLIYLIDVVAETACYTDSRWLRSVFQLNESLKELELLLRILHTNYLLDSYT